MKSINDIANYINYDKYLSDILLNEDNGRYNCWCTHFDNKVAICKSLVNDIMKNRKINCYYPNNIYKFSKYKFRITYWSSDRTIHLCFTRLFNRNNIITATFLFRNWIKLVKFLYKEQEAYLTIIKELSNKQYFTLKNSKSGLKNFRLNSKDKIYNDYYFSPNNKSEYYGA